MQEHVYRTPARDIDELKQKFIDIWYSIPQQGIFQDLEHGGCQPTLGGPFPSLLLSPFLSPSLSFPSLPPLPLKPGGVVRKLGGINPPEGVWETPCSPELNRRSY